MDKVRINNMIIAMGRLRDDLGKLELEIANCVAIMDNAENEYPEPKIGMEELAFDACQEEAKILSCFKPGGS